MFSVGATQKTTIRVPTGAARMSPSGVRGAMQRFPDPTDIPFLQDNRFRVTVIVLDSAGIGVMPNHPIQDIGSNTIANVATYFDAHYPGEFSLPNFQALGLGNIANITGVAPAENPAGAFGVLTLDPITMTDTITGHWGLMGLNTGEYPTYLDGMPDEIMDRVEAEVSQKLGTPVEFIKDGRNISGTTVIEERGKECEEQSAPLAYTSSDSVFQIAHCVGREMWSSEVEPEDDNLLVIKEGGKRFLVNKRELEKMCAICKAAREALDESPNQEDKFLRVIARPFISRERPGPKGEKYIRITSLRKDYTLAVPGNTILDHAGAAGFQTTGIGKFYDIFSGKGLKWAWPDVSEDRHLKDDMEGLDFIVKSLRLSGAGIIGTNLVCLDELYGHRNDPFGYARNLMAIDARLPEIFKAMLPWDIVIITADHGNDPTRGLTKLWMEKCGLDPEVFMAKGTNHTREFVPFLAFGNPILGGVSIGIKTMADVGATLARYLGFSQSPHGISFLDEVLDRSVFEFV